MTTANSDTIRDFTIEPNDRIVCKILDPLISSIQVNHNGHKWATLPVIWGKFSCQLPAKTVQDETTESIDFINANTNQQIGHFEWTSRPPLKNIHGLTAAQILQQNHIPFTVVPWARFDGITLTLGGYQLPPGGDPSRIKVKANPGVVYNFLYPVESQMGEQLWYWPNSHLSGFQLEINLAASESNSDPFNISFIDTESDEKPIRIYFPTEMSDFVGLPRDINQMERVQNNDICMATLTGYQAFKIIEKTLSEYHIVNRPGVAILDWGSGYGRVSRHFIKYWPQSEIWGADVDADNITWAQKNLSKGHFVTLPLLPPSSIPDQKFDVIFGISVMTHLTADAQAAWITELARCLNPNGLALITFAGQTAVTYSSKWFTPEWWTRWLQTGFNDSTSDPALGTHIADNSYYRQTFQSEKDVCARWSEQFDVLKVIPAYIGNLDVAILLKK